MSPRTENVANIVHYCVTQKNNAIIFQYSEPGSNRHGHYWPQDFKSGVSTYSTIRAAAFTRKAGQKYELIFYSARKQRLVPHKQAVPIHLFPNLFEATECSRIGCVKQNYIRPPLTDGMPAICYNEFSSGRTFASGSPASPDNRSE